LQRTALRAAAERHDVSQSRNPRSGLSPPASEGTGSPGITGPRVQAQAEDQPRSAGLGLVAAGPRVSAHAVVRAEKRPEITGRVPGYR
jgi:hypothetical protein